MNKFLNVFFLLIFLTVSNYENSSAQCMEFVKTTGLRELNTEIYVPEGRFDVLTLSQGDYLTVYKSFFRGKTYKIVVIAESNIPSVKFQVKTMQGEIIYDNSDAKDTKTWEYTSDKNQNLQIEVKLPTSSSGEKPETGCIAVILGYKL